MSNPKFRFGSIREAVEARRRLFSRTGSIKTDREFVRCAFNSILRSVPLLQELHRKPYLLIEAAFTIVDKHRRTVPFFLNTVQRKFIAELEKHGAGRPYFVLKGRQQGFTSLITAIQLSYSLLMRNFAGLTVADCTDNTLAIFNDKAKTVYNALPDVIKPHEKYNSARELYFDKLGSSWRVATATDDAGRSRTLNFLHLSEIAFYEADLTRLQAGLLEATTAESIVIYESTANGFNDAKALWDTGSCINLFYRWWDTPEYVDQDVTVLKTVEKPLKERLDWLKSLGLTDYQLAWYAKKYASYIDKNMIKQEYPCTAEEAFVGSSDCLFDKEELVRRLAEPDKAVLKGDFRYVKSYCSDGTPSITDIEFVPDDNGIITLSELPVRVKGEKGLKLKPYAIGGDTAGSGEDYFTAKAVDCISRRTVATLRVKRIDEDLYADRLYCLGRYYNDALLAVESNYSSAPLRTLEALAYPNLYRRERNDAGGVTRLVGFETNLKTRPLIISNLVALFREDSGIESDKTTLREMLTFVRGKSGRGEADKGCHDDLVMALAIAQYAANKADKTYGETLFADDSFIERNFATVKKKKINLW